MPTEMPNERKLHAPGAMELDPTGDGLATDETLRLIASSKVEGTTVFDREGREIGTIMNFMVDKVSGQVAYAVLAFGGFLGLGESHHPLPWRALTYDPKLGGYVVDIDRTVLNDAPRQPPGADAFGDPAFGGRVDAYY